MVVLAALVAPGRIELHQGRVRSARTDAMGTPRRSKLVVGAGSLCGGMSAPPVVITEFLRLETGYSRGEACRAVLRSMKLLVGCLLSFLPLVSVFLPFCLFPYPFELIVFIASPWIFPFLAALLISYCHMSLILFRISLVLLFKMPQLSLLITATLTSPPPKSKRNI